MRRAVYIILIWLGMPQYNQSSRQPQPVVIIPGDIMLGVVIPIHHMDPKNNGCGLIQMEDGIQTLEAVLYVVDKINNDRTLLSDVTLGIVAMDSCDNIEVVTRQMLKFAEGFVARRNRKKNNILVCEDGHLPNLAEYYFEDIVGIIGGQSSTISIQLANILKVFMIPQISYLSTSAALSDQRKYPYFFRTVSSDLNQARAILEILREFSWTYSGLVYSDTDYGRAGYEKLQELAPYYNVCFTKPLRLLMHTPNPADYDGVVDYLATKTNARAVVLFAEKITTVKLMEAVKRQNMIGRFLWIGSDGWSSRTSIFGGLNEVVEGAITVMPLLGEVPGYDGYFKSLRPTLESRNPWFSEFWESHFKCSLTQTNSSRKCSPDLQISESNDYYPIPYLHFIHDAVYAFAHALHNYEKYACRGNRYSCTKLNSITGEELRPYVSNVTFKDVFGSPFRFVSGFEGPPRYSILLYKQTFSSEFQWIQIGNYSLNKDGETLLYLNKNALKFTSHGQGEIPASICSHPCKVGQIKVRSEEDVCCWQCRDCLPWQTVQNSLHCENCPLGMTPDPTKSFCINIDESYISYSNLWATGAMVFSGLGILLTLLVGIVFKLYNSTPIIKAAGRELSYILLLGTLLSFSTTFIIVSPPTRVSCGLTRFFIGFCYTLAYAAIVTKTNRIARIFNNQNSWSRTRYTSPASQIVITMMLTSIEVIINVTWLYYQPPEVIHVYPDRFSRVLICTGLNTYSYLIGLIYPFILIGCCTIYAIKTRKCPGGFNEARYIAFTNYTTCIIWLAFVPLYLASANNNIRVVTLSMSLSLSALVQLGCLFFPKLYIVLYKPEKNTRESVMAQHRNTGHIYAYSIGYQNNTENGGGGILLPEASLRPVSTSPASLSSMAEDSRKDKL